MKNLMFIFWLLLFCKTGLIAQPNQEWVVFQNGPQSDFDIPIDLEIGNDESVYVVGIETFNALFNYQISLVKYDSGDGSLIWEANYSFGDSSFTEPTALALDDSGNAYITGFRRVDSVFSEFDIITIKCNENGNTDWIAIYDSASSYDKSNDIVLDELGNVYVVGESNFQCITLKYDNNGNLQWNRKYGDPQQNNTYANKIKIDTSGNLYVAGNSTFNIDLSDFLVLKYSPYGDLIWAQIYDGPMQQIDILTDMEIFPDGSIAVCGTSEADHSGFMDNDYFTIKYSSNGDTVWTERYDGGVGSDYPNDLEIDAAGNVYLTGWSISAIFDSISTDTVYLKSVTTQKISPDGSSEWVRKYSGNNLYFNNGSQLKIDSNYGVYVCGDTETSTFNQDLLILKYDSTGNMLWDEIIDGPANSWDFGVDIALYDDYTFFVTGVLSNQSSDWDWGTMKYTQNANRLDNVKEKSPNEFKMFENYPNPFNPSTTLIYQLPKKENVQILIYNILGQEIRSLLNEVKETGRFNITWDGKNNYGHQSPSGIYFIKMKAGSFTKIRKMMLIK